MPELTPIDDAITAWRTMRSASGRQACHPSDWPDATSDALQALWRGLEQYDPGRGTPLRTYLVFCIKHNIINGQRSRDGRQFKRLAFRMAMSRLDAVRTSPDQHTAALRDLIEARPAPSRMLDRDAFLHLTRGLPRVHRLAVELYYWRGLTMLQIGRRLGLSESRVSQMLAQALEFLREARRGE